MNAKEAYKFKEFLQEKYISGLISRETKLSLILAINEEQIKKLRGDKT